MKNTRRYMKTRIIRIWSWIILTFNQDFSFQTDPPVSNLPHSNANILSSLRIAYPCLGTPLRNLIPIVSANLSNFKTICVHIKALELKPNTRSFSKTYPLPENLTRPKIGAKISFQLSAIVSIILQSTYISNYDVSKPLRAELLFPKPKFVLWSSRIKTSIFLYKPTLVSRRGSRCPRNGPKNR